MFRSLLSNNVLIQPDDFFQLKEQSLFHLLRSNLLVHDVKSKSISSSLDLSYQVSNLLDTFNLLTKVFSLQEVTEMSITLSVTSLVQV